MATAAELEVLIRGDTKPLDDALNDADQKTQTFAQRMGINQRSVTRFFAGLGAAALAGVGAGIAKAIEFESAFANVRKTVDGTDEELQALQDTLRAMATDTSNPLSALENSATTLMNIAARGGQLGVATEDLAEFAQVVGNLTVATDMSADSAAVFLARYANVAKLDVSQYVNLSDVLVTLGNNMAADESEIAAFANNLASLANYDWNHDEIMGYAAAMASLGLGVEAGSTALTRVNQTLIEIANSPTDLASFAADLGLVADDFANLVANDPSDAMTTFLAAYGQLSDVEKINFRDEFGLSDVRVTLALDKLSGGYETLAEALDLSTEAFQGNNAAMNEAAAKADTTEGRINQFKNNLNEFGASLGEVFLPLINDILPRVTDFLSGMDISGGMAAWETNIDRLGLIFELMLGRVQRATEGWMLDLRKRFSEFFVGLVQPLADAQFGPAVEFVQNQQGVADDIYFEQLQQQMNQALEGQMFNMVMSGNADLNFDWGSSTFSENLAADSGFAERMVGQMDGLTQSMVMRALQTAFSENDAVSAGGLMELTNLIDPTRTRELLTQELQDAIQSGDAALFEAYTNMDITEFVLGDETLATFQQDLQSKLEEDIYTATVDIVLFGNLHTSALQQQITAEIAAQQGVAATVLPQGASANVNVTSYGNSPLQLAQQVNMALRAGA